MIAFDTNLLFPALERSHADHPAARAWLESFGNAPTGAGEVAISELVLMELYVLVRNPAVVRRPLDARSAAALVERLRTRSDWRLLDAPAGLMGEVWRLAAAPDFGRRRVFDARLGLSLVRQGVREFATRNVRDFANLGFARVFDPLAAKQAPTTSQEGILSVDDRRRVDR